MKLSKSLAAFAVLAMAVVNNVHADQIDNEAHELAQAPAAVLVKVDQDAKKVHVYRVNSLDARVKARSMDEATMNAYASTIAVDANKVGEMDIVTSASELDNEASTQAWWGRWWGYGWGGYGWAGADTASVMAATDMASVTAGAGDVVAGVAGTGKKQPLVSLIN